MRDEWEIDEGSQEVRSLADQFQNLEFEDDAVDEVLREEAELLIPFSVSNDVLELKRLFKSAQSSLQQQAIRLLPILPWKDMRIS